MTRRLHAPRRAKVERIGLAITLHQQADRIYNNMRWRFGPKVGAWPAKKLLSGWELPFTRADFEAWVLKQFNGNPDSAIRCAYCNTFINAGSMVCDHKISPKRRDLADVLWLVEKRDVLEIQNLCLVCQPCNTLKGDLSPEEFAQLT